MIDDVYNIVYSHIDYSDIWPAYFGQMEKYFNNFSKNVIFIDKKSDLIPDNYVQILYDDKKTYVERLIQCFEQLRDLDICIFAHEDMFLYDYPKMDKINKYIDAVKEGNFDFIKLLKGGDCIFKFSDVDESLYELDNRSNWLFSIQPTIWKISSFLKLLKHHKKDNIWVFEDKSQKTCRKLKLKAGFSHGKGIKRGQDHWDNDVYPFIATAIVKGKWNTLEYNNILRPILDQYNIDISIRGEFKQ